MSFAFMKLELKCVSENVKALLLQMQLIINLTPCQNNVEKFEMEYAYAKSAPFGKDLQNRQPDTQVKRTIRIFIKNRTK